MKKITLDKVKPYEAAKHFNMTALRLSGKEETGAEKFWIGLSHFLPHGGAEMSASTLERAYFLINGSMLVKGKTEEHILEPGDLLCIAAGEEREVQVIGTEPATILVIMTKVD